MKYVFYALVASSGIYATYTPEPSAWDAFKQACWEYQERCKKEAEERHKNQQPYHPRDYHYQANTPAHVMRYYFHGYHFQPVSTIEELKAIQNPKFPEKPCGNMSFLALAGEWYILNARTVDKYFEGKQTATIGQVLREHKVDQTHWHAVKAPAKDGRIKPLTELTLEEFKEFVSKM